VVDRCPIRFLRWGSPATGQPLLVLQHGGAAHARWWSFVAPLLAEDCCVVAPELSGHGDSGWRDGYRLEQWADEVLAVAEAASAGGPADDPARTPPALAPPPVVLGHSLGGQVVAAAAARARGRVGPLILCDARFGSRRRPPRRARHFAGSFRYPTREEALGRFALIPQQPCANPFVLRHVAETSVVERDGAWAWKFDWAVFAHGSDRPGREYLADITGPVAFLYGVDSAIATEEVLGKAVAAYGRPAPVVPIPAAHHHVWLDQPLAFVAALRALMTAWAAPPPG
jgi:pimeloyl-ACP methyl ester carboxylesterase